MWNYSHNTTSASLTSELRINSIDEKNTIDGYYWCSVNSSDDTDTMTPNPSMVLHILHRIDCTTKTESRCEAAVNFFSAHPDSVPRCADHNVSVDIVEAQNCTTGTRIEPTTEQKLGSDIDPQITDGLDVQNVSSTLTSTSMTKTFTLPLTLGIIAGASMGGLILVLFILIGLLLVCVVRMKANKHRQGINQVDSSTPFDGIQMPTSALATDKNETDDASRVSKMFLESNISYECPQDIISTSQIQTNENVYACIH